MAEEFAPAIWRRAKGRKIPGKGKVFSVSGTASPQRFLALVELEGKKEEKALGEIVSPSGKFPEIGARVLPVLRIVGKTESLVEYCFKWILLPGEKK